MPDKPYITPIINSKAAQENLFKIKNEHSETLVNLQLHKERIVNENMIREQKRKEEAVANQDIMAREQERMDKEQERMMKLQKEERDRQQKERELQIKMKALSAE